MRGNLKFILSSLGKWLIVLLVRCGGSSMTVIRLTGLMLYPFYRLRVQKSRSAALQYLQPVRPGEPERELLRQYACNKMDQALWAILYYNAREAIARHNDWRESAVLRQAALRGRGLIVLGFHYGPQCDGYLLNELGFHPLILASAIMIPHLSGGFGEKLLTNDIRFRGTYSGLLPARKSERAIVAGVRAGRTVLLLTDMILDGRNLPVTVLGAPYSIGTFAFKLALNGKHPLAVLWMSKIAGGGYRMHVRELQFTTVEEGVRQYAAIMDAIVTENPFQWRTGEYNVLQQKQQVNVS